MSTAEVFAPDLSVLMNLTGETPFSRIQNITFSGITFANTEAKLPEVAGSAGKSTVQAATWKTAYSDENWHNDKYTAYDIMLGAINVNSASSIHFEDNVIKHIGNEGINFNNDVVDSHIVGNAILDIGGSGINISHPQHVYIGDGGTYEKYDVNVEGAVLDVLVENNLIYDATRLYYGHAAITAFFPNGLTIEHNQIQNTQYSGVSLGWGWNNFNEINVPSNPTTVAGNNKFNYNRVYNIMTRLHDGGAFYTLGSQPNSEASGNYVKAPTTNLQGVYHPDEGTAWYTGNDLVFEIVPGQDNFELNVWRDKHDNNYDNIYSTSSSSQTGAPNSSITNLHVYPTGDWPIEAQNIIAAAGLESNYQHLLDGIPNPPDVPGVTGPSNPLIPDTPPEPEPEPESQPQPEPQPESSENFKLVKRNANGFAVDGGNGAVVGQSVELYTNINHNNLTWTEISRGDGHYSYQKLNTDVCMDGGDGGANGQDVTLQICDVSNINQQWQKIDAGSGHYQLQKRGTNFSLDGDQGGAVDQSVYLWNTRSLIQNQHWRFDERP